MLIMNRIELKLVRMVFILVTSILLYLALINFYTEGDERVKSSEVLSLPFEDIMNGPVSIRQDDPLLIKRIRTHFLVPPSNLPYNLSGPAVNASEGQVFYIDALLQKKKNGFFIECGALDGETLSNSVYLEKEYGWKGILIEADPKNFDLLLQKNRKSWKVPACLSTLPYPNKVLFKQEFVLSKMITNLTLEENAGSLENMVEVQCFPLYSIMLALNQTKVDYFSLDVEGVEVEVLKTIPWDKVNITRQCEQFSSKLSFGKLSRNEYISDVLVTDEINTLHPRYIWPASGICRRSMKPNDLSRWVLLTRRSPFWGGCDCVSGLYPNSGPTILPSAGNDPGEVSSPSSVNSNFFKSSYLDNKNEIMLVTNEPLTSPHLALPCSLFSTNSNIINPNINGTHPRAAKYFIDDSSSLSQPHMLEGCENLGIDSIYGQDNPGFDPSFNFLPFGDLRSLDPGYGSERSENEDGDEEEMGEDDEKSYSSSDEYSPNPRHSFFEPPQGIPLDVAYLMKIFPFINEGTLFDVIVVKNSRGLGIALTGGIECDTGVLPGLIRIRTIYPQTPAWLCGQLQVNDFILEANGNQLTGLTSHEALEVLRVAGTEVNLVVCRAPAEVLNGKDDMSPIDIVGRGDRGVVSTSLTSAQPISGNHLLSPSPTSFSLCGEFEIIMKKVSGSLGFTLRKNDNSILGHTIRSLVKEPALSDGRLRPGDKLLSVNGTDMCGLSHEEAVHFLRTCPETVIIRIYRDAIQTPVSPASPTEPEFSKPKPLRKEARDMLSDLASRKQSSPNPLGDTDVSTTRRRRLKHCTPESKAERWESLVRKAEEDSNNISVNRDISPFDNSHSETLTAASSRSGTVVSRSSSSEISFKDISRPTSPAMISKSISPESRPRRPDFLDLNSSYCSRKSQFTPPHEDPCMLHSPTITQFNSLDSAPQLTSTHSDTPAFTHLQSCYRSVNVSSSPFSEKRLINTTSDHNISGCHDDNTCKENTLLKWKGVVFTPEDEKDNEISMPDFETSSSDQDSRVLIVEMIRGWNSRLGFSLQNSNDGKDTEIVAIYADSLAARDGRLKVGDVIKEVNGHDVQFWDAQDVIDLLRKTRGKIILKVLQM